MSDYRSCKHCGGTSFCGGFKNAEGQVKTRTACTTCVVKSALDPKVVYDKVVCSVCGGTGVVKPGQEGGLARLFSRHLLVLAVVLILISGVSLVLSIVTFTRGQQNYQQLVEKLAQEAKQAGPGISREELRDRLQPGMTQEQVRTELGQPNGTKEVNRGFGDVELWSYECTDGHLELTFLDGKLRPLGP
jgi:hypothetical protein